MRGGKFCPYDDELPIIERLQGLEGQIAEDAAFDMHLLHDALWRLVDYLEQKRIHLDSKELVLGHARDNLTRVRERK